MRRNNIAVVLAVVAAVVALLVAYGPWHSHKSVKSANQPLSASQKYQCSIGAAACGISDPTGSAPDSGVVSGTVPGCPNNCGPDATVTTLPKAAKQAIVGATPFYASPAKRCSAKSTLCQATAGGPMRQLANVLQYCSAQDNFCVYFPLGSGVTADSNVEVASAMIDTASGKVPGRTYQILDATGEFMEVYHTSLPAQTALTQDPNWAWNPPSRTTWQGDPAVRTLAPGGASQTLESLKVWHKGTVYMLFVIMPKDDTTFETFLNSLHILQ